MEEKKAEEKKVMPKCQTIDCGQTAKFHCPTCEKLGLEPAYFCSQECFKKYWPIHKTYHNKSSALPPRSAHACTRQHQHTPALTSTHQHTLAHTRMHAPTPN